MRLLQMLQQIHNQKVHPMLLQMRSFYQKHAGRILIRHLFWESLLKAPHTLKITSNPPNMNAIIVPKKPAPVIHSPDKTTHPQPSIAPSDRKSTSTFDIDFVNSLLF